MSRRRCPLISKFVYAKCGHRVGDIKHVAINTISLNALHITPDRILFGLVQFGAFSLPGSSLMSKCSELASNGCFFFTFDSVFRSFAERPSRLLCLRMRFSFIEHLRIGAANPGPFIFIKKISSTLLIR